jgi:hypothetical protein
MRCIALALLFSVCTCWPVLEVQAGLIHDAAKAGDQMLARLQALSNDHFGWSPGEVNWSHVGTLGHYAELLKRITDSAFNEGDHAGG